MARALGKIASPEGATCILNCKAKREGNFLPPPFGALCLTQSKSHGFGILIDWVLGNSFAELWIDWPSTSPSVPFFSPFGPKTQFRLGNLDIGTKDRDIARTFGRNGSKRTEVVDLAGIWVMVDRAHLVL